MSGKKHPLTIDVYSVSGDRAWLKIITDNPKLPVKEINFTDFVKQAAPLIEYLAALRLPTKKQQADQDADQEGQPSKVPKHN